MKRRVIQLIGPVLIVVGVIWAAIAVASTTVQITKPSGKSETVTINSNKYETHRYAEGGGYRNRTGEPLSQVLKEIGVTDDDWFSITINGLTVGNGAFKPNKRPPIFFVKGQDEIVFYKPKDAEGPYETRSAKGGSNLLMSFQALLEVEASDDTPKAGQTVTYETTVRDGGPQNGYEFSWSATGGSPTSGSGSTFKYTYPESGGSVDITVTAKRASDGETVGTGGITSDKLDPKPQESASGTGGTSTGTYGSGLGTGGYTYPDTTYPSTEPNFPDIPSDTPDVKTPEVPETATGQSVKGELLSLDTPVPSTPGQPAPEASPATPEPDMAAADDKPAEITGPGAVIGAGVIFTLLGLGAGREFETFSPKQMMRRPDFNRLRRIAFPRWK